MAMGSTTYEWIADYTGFLTDPSKWEYTSRRGCSAVASCLESRDQTSGSSQATSRRFTRRCSALPTAGISGSWAGGAGRAVP